MTDEDPQPTTLQSNGPAPHTTQAPRPGPAHPQAKAFYEIARDLSEADRRAIWDAANARLRPTGATAAEEQSVFALISWADERDLARASTLAAGAEPPSWSVGPFSKPRYVEFRASRERPREWPSASFVLKHLGQGHWGRAADRAGLEPAVDVMARQMIAPTARRIGHAALMGLAREWQQEVDAEQVASQHTPDGLLSRADFLGWLYRKELEPDWPHPPLPKETALRAVIGPWSKVLADLGQSHRHYQQRFRDGALSSWVPAPEIKEIIERLDWAGPREASAPLDWLEWVGEALTNDQRRQLSLEQFRRIRRAMVGVAHAATGDERRRLAPLIEMPTGERLIRDAGTTWVEAKIKTSLMEAPDLRRQRHRGPISDEQLHRDLDHARRLYSNTTGHGTRDPGAQITTTFYAEWRQSELERREDEVDLDPRQKRVGSVPTLLLRFGQPSGSWDAVITSNDSWLRSNTDDASLGSGSIPAAEAGHLRRRSADGAQR